MRKQAEGHEEIKMMSVIRNCAVNSRSSTGHFGALLSDLRGEG